MRKILVSASLSRTAPSPRQYLMEIMTERIDLYLKTHGSLRGVDGYSDLCHSFFNWLEADLDKNGI